MQSNQRGVNLLPKSLDSSSLRRLELLTIRSRRAFLGMTQGIHVSLKRGHGIEFSDYRRYEPGDNPRDIDWNLYGRSDRMYVKTFNEEQNLAVYIVVDGSKSMRLPTNSDKWDFSSSIALSLAYVALSQRDEVSLSILGGRSLLKVTSLREFSEMARMFTESPPRDPDLVDQFKTFTSRIKAPGILIFISDLLFPDEILEPITRYAQSKNLDTTFIQILSDFDTQPYNFKLHDIVDGETNLRGSIKDSISPNVYDQLLNEHLQKLKNHLTKARIRLVTETDLSDPIKFIGTNLKEVGLIS